MRTNFKSGLRRRSSRKIVRRKSVCKLLQTCSTRQTRQAHPKSLDADPELSPLVDLVQNDVGDPCMQNRVSGAGGTLIAMYRSARKDHAKTSRMKIPAVIAKPSEIGFMKAPANGLQLPSDPGLLLASMNRLIRQNELPGIS